MSAAPGYIGPETLGQIESIIDRDGLLGDTEPTSQAQQSTQSGDNDPEEQGNQSPAPDGGADASAEDLDPQEGEDNAGEGEEAKGSDGEESIASLGDIAKEFDVEESELLENVLVDNGLGYQVPLREALDGWRETSTNLLARQEQIEQEFQSKLGELNTKTDEQLRQLGALASVLASELDAEFKGVDMDDLKVRAPLQYAEMIERRQRREKLIRDAVEQFDLQSGQRSAQAQADIDRLKQREATMLAQKMPHWAKDPELARQVVEENTALMRGLGYSDEDIAGVMDHRHILILHWAAQWRKSLAAGKSKTLEKLRKQKGLKRPGMVRRATARPDEADPVQGARKTLANSLKKTGTAEDAGRLIETFIRS